MLVSKVAGSIRVTAARADKMSDPLVIVVLPATQGRGHVLDL